MPVAPAPLHTVAPRFAVWIAEYMTSTPISRSGCGFQMVRVPACQSPEFGLHCEPGAQPLMNPEGAPTAVLTAKPSALFGMPKPGAPAHIRFLALCPQLMADMPPQRVLWSLGVQKCS